MVDFSDMIFFVGWSQNISRNSFHQDRFLSFFLVLGLLGVCANASAIELSKDNLINAQAMDAKFLIKIGVEQELIKPLPPVVQNPVINPVIQQDETGLIPPIGWCPVMPIDPVNIHPIGNGIPIGEPINEVGGVKGAHGGGRPKTIVAKKPTRGDQDAVVDGLSSLQKKAPQAVALTTNPKTHLSQVVAIDGVSDRELSEQAFIAKAVNRDGVVAADRNMLTSVTIVLMQPDTDELPLLEDLLK
ncbi:MAG: hypothetical protein K2X01_11915 [Cyanobacteria bacterium]|nr:hypothetical protein [Cyanobacteriota bacterium]